VADEAKKNPSAVRFGANLLSRRKAAGLSQEETAYSAGVHRTEVGLLERGERVPRIDTVVKVAAALSVPPGDLLDGIIWEVPKSDEGRIRIEPSEDE